MRELQQLESDLGKVNHASNTLPDVYHVVILWRRCNGMHGVVQDTDLYVCVFVVLLCFEIQELHKESLQNLLSQLVLTVGEATDDKGKELCALFKEVRACAMLDHYRRNYQ